MSVPDTTAAIRPWPGAAADPLAICAQAAPAVGEVEVAVLGAGMSGLCMGVTLRRAGLTDFVILEQSAGLGGTWWDNRYPGAHVDVPAPLYAFSFAPNPRWRQRFAAAPEIQSYMQDVARTHGLLPHLRLGTRLVRATFDANAGCWHLALGDGTVMRARFLVCSTGPLSQPRWPDIPGIDTFAGVKLHSARWDASAKVAGLRVGVIGTGSTASQLVPPLAREAGRLHVFQRTANWVLPRIDRRYHALDHLLARLPPVAALTRRFWYHVLEWGRHGFEEGTLARRGMLETAALHLRRQVSNSALRAKLHPPYPLGCKRIIYSNDFYPALAQPNVELVTEAITRLTPMGIVTADGSERPLDVLVCATGFDTTHLLASLEVRGLGGQLLSQAWRDGPEAWHGLTVAGFPNLFLMLGPNTGTGHTSTLLYIEPQARYALACIQQVHVQRQRWIDIKPEVMRAHNQALQRRLAGSVWTQCRSWYRMEGGRVVALWPGYTREYLQAVAHPRFADYTFG